MSSENAITVDPVSLLVEVTAAKALDSLETELAARGFTLGVALAQADPAVTIGDCLAQGAPGAASVFADPADHLVAGLEATLPNGKKLEGAPARDGRWVRISRRS